MNPAQIQNPENTNCKISSMALDEQLREPKPWTNRLLRGGFTGHGSVTHCVRRI